MANTGIIVFLSFISSEAESMAKLLDLTSREKEILQSIQAGRINEAIAAEFQITEKPVEFHLDHISWRVDGHENTGSRPKLGRFLARFRSPAFL